ncbi:energy transducer TonB [Shewanella sp. Scap07]|uniref:energy transducer TonB n=1 Tax=Shewanella sp. Scap07 TaxID=2589987 RepID=UPI0015BC05E5|nr:energy transducer TonB [Shewanella sp. Scap07]QLE87366.1 energy transducer TonB [Shewanella sp. Scap07]
MSRTALLKPTLTALFGGIITLALFAFMASLINIEHQPPGEIAKAPEFNLSFIPDESPPEKKTYDLTPPKPAVAPPSIPKLQPTDDNTMAVAVTMPSMVTPTINYQGRQATDAQALPVIQISPQYPIDAAQRGKEGYVIVNFDISSSGSVENVSVVEAHPKRIFNRAAIQAIKKWKYKPKIENGQAVPQGNQHVQLDFKLDQMI